MPLPIFELPDDTLQCIFKSAVASVDYCGVAAIARSLLKVSQIRRNQSVVRILYAALCDKRQRDCADATASLGSRIGDAADAEHVARVAYRLERVWHIADFLIRWYVIDRVGRLIYAARQLEHPYERHWFCSDDSWYTTGDSWRWRCDDVVLLIQRIGSGMAGNFAAGAVDRRMQLEGTHESVTNVIDEWKNDILGRFFRSADITSLGIDLLGQARTDEFTNMQWTETPICRDHDCCRNEFCSNLQGIREEELRHCMKSFMCDMLIPYMLRESKTFASAAHRAPAREPVLGPLRTALSHMVLDDRPAFWKKRRLVGFMSYWLRMHECAVAKEL